MRQLKSKKANVKVKKSKKKKRKKNRRQHESSIQRLTSTVTTLIPAGFQLRPFFHPSTHIAPKLKRLTVPSPSPIFTPFFTRGNARSLVYDASIQLRLNRTGSIGRVSGFEHASPFVSRDPSRSYSPCVYLFGIQYSAMRKWARERTNKTFPSPSHVHTHNRSS